VWTLTIQRQNLTAPIYRRHIDGLSTSNRLQKEDLDAAHS
jgi:hypothetical protein